MRTLTVRQPWASLIASGAKTIEIRSRRTNYRGPIVILAGKGSDPQCDPDTVYPHGVTLCVVELIDCVPLAPEHQESSCVPTDRFSAAVKDGNFAWVLSEPIPVKPVAVRGQLGLVRLPQEVAQQLAAA
jgi:hypothetical protein